MITEVNFTDNSFIGELKNTYDEPVTLPGVRLTCFTTSGIPLANGRDFAKPATMAPGGRASFSIGHSDSCPVYILGASGFTPLY